MKSAFLFLFAAVLSISALAQEKVVQDANAQQRQVGSFHGVKVSNGIELILTQGGKEAVAVSAVNDLYRNRIKTEVQNGILKIYYDTNLWGELDRAEKKLKAYVSCKDIDDLNGSSGSRTSISGNLNSRTLAVTLSSGAGLNGAIDAGSLSVHQSSGSLSHINGKAEVLTVETSSGADFRGYDLRVDKCNAHASSGSSIQVTVNKELEAGANSGGGIRYKGNGVITNISANSGGSVKKSS